MSGGLVVREGRAVREGGVVEVRFPNTCGVPGAAGCAGCGGERRVPAGRLGLVGPLGDGERVEVAVPGPALTRLALVCFAVPLAALLAGAWIGDAVAGAAGASSALVTGLPGLLALAGALLLVARRGGALVRWLELRVRVVSRSACGPAGPQADQDTR